MKQYRCTVHFANGDAIQKNGTPLICLCQALGERGHLATEHNRILKIVGDMGEEYKVDNIAIQSIISEK